MLSIKRSTSRTSGGTGGGGGGASGSRPPSFATNRTMTKCGKCCYYFRQVITFLFSHIGLGTLLLGYALVGAFTFQALEYEHEQQQRSQMKFSRDRMIMEIFNMTNRSSVLIPKNWTQNAEKILKKFEIEFLHAVKYKGYDGSEELTSKTSSQWSFSGALLYSIIVITTIGYGNVAPRTDWGKVVTILYAIIGIPLMLFCLSNIGHTMARSFKFIYWRCCCYLCVKPKKAQRQRRRRIRRRIRKHRRTQRNHELMMRLQPLEANHANPRFESPITHVGHKLSRSPSSRSAVIWQDGNESICRFSDTAVNASLNLPSTPTRRSFVESSTIPRKNFDSNNLSNNQNTLQLPVPQRNPTPHLLSRSMSARYHNEIKSKKRLMLTKSTTPTSIITKNKNISPIKTTRKTTMNIPVICNRYASCSEEFIDGTYQANPDEHQLKATNPHQSVRFQSTNQLNLFSSTSSYTKPTSMSNNHPRQPHRSISVIEPPIMLSIPTPEPPEQSSESPSANQGVGDGLQSSFPNNNSNILAYAEGDFSDMSDLSDSGSDDDSDIQEKNIPIAVCLALVIGYICGGAWFFSVSEEWTFLDASYFCFITLSTIGFGDLVPGRTVLSTTPENGQMTLAICALYLLFGMALLAMSLNLVKEKVLETVRIIGERIGILVSDEEEEDY